MVYTIIRKRQVFHALANLPSDCNTIAKSLSKRQRKHMPSTTSTENVNETAMEGSHPAQPAEPGTLKATLLETPGIEKMTEKESAHPLSPSSDVDVNKSNIASADTPSTQAGLAKSESIVTVSMKFYNFIHTVPL